jgi:hypothetical protein
LLACFLVAIGPNNSIPFVSDSILLDITRLSNLVETGSSPIRLLSYVHPSWNVHDALSDLIVRGHSVQLIGIRAISQ